MTTEKIPDDVMDAVDTVISEHRMTSGAGLQNAAAMKNLIARAIMAERERCARKVDQFATDWGVAYKTMIDQISEAIRNPTNK